jgi:hypothetical protein
MRGRLQIPVRATIAGSQSEQLQQVEQRLRAALDAAELKLVNSTNEMKSVLSAASKHFSIPVFDADSLIAQLLKNNKQNNNDAQETNRESPQARPYEPFGSCRYRPGQFTSPGNLSDGLIISMNRSRL